MPLGIEAGLRRGWKPEIILEAVTDVAKWLRGKPPPEHWRYLLKPIERAHAERAGFHGSEQDETRKRSVVNLGCGFLRDGDRGY